MIYTITVTQNGEDITSRLAEHPSVDAWSPDMKGDHPSRARQGEPIKSLDQLSYGEAMVALGQIIDNGREWGPTDEEAEHLYQLAELIVQRGEGYLATPDGYLIHVTSAYGAVTYQKVLQTFRNLLEVENLDEGLSNEYIRGGVNLMADLFGKYEMDTGERMEQILNELRHLNAN
jgi:hypothetical protein